MKQSQILYLIADFSAGERKIIEALQAGVDMVQLREKDISSAEYLRRAKWMRQMTRKYPCLFIVNDRIDIAALSRADGVHLGQSDVPVDEARAWMGKDMIIGATARTAEQAVKAQQMGADYIGSGAWFSTSTKEDAQSLKPETFRDIKARIRIPAVGVGGISPENADLPLQNGADGLAVSAGILKYDSVAVAVRKFREKLQRYAAL